MIKPTALLAAMHSVLLLLLLCNSLPVSHATPSSTGSVSDAQQCTTPGTCADDAKDHPFREHLSKIEPYATNELAKALSEYFDTGDTGGGITTVMQKHVERSLLAKTFPNTGPNTELPSYASFGSLLDISTMSSSTWSGSTEFGGKIPWIASLLNRQSLIGEEGKPCRVGVLDDNNGKNGESCLIGATVEKYVSVRGDEDIKRQDMHLAAEFGILDKGDFLSGNVMNLDFGGRKFDSIVANGVLAAVDTDVDRNAKPMEDMDLVLEKLVSFLNPGGTLYLIGNEPMGTVKGAGAVHKVVMNVFDSVKSLSGEYPKRELSAEWIKRNLARLGLNVSSSTLFPVFYSYDDVTTTMDEMKEWFDELQGFKKSYSAMLGELDARVKEAAKDGPIFTGEHTYIIAAEYPSKSYLLQLCEAMNIC